MCAAVEATGGEASIHHHWGVKLLVRPDQLSLLFHWYGGSIFMHSREKYIINVFTWLMQQITSAHCMC